MKTRSLAQALVTGGKVRVNKDKVTDGARKVRIDDVLTIRVARQVHVVRIVGFAAARVPASETPNLYARVDDGPSAAAPRN